MSGKTAGTPGCRLVGPAGEIELSEGVIIAARHLHLSEAQCALFGLRDGQPVRLRAEGERAVVFENVICLLYTSFSADLQPDLQPHHLPVRVQRLPEGAPAGLAAEGR